MSMDGRRKEIILLRGDRRSITLKREGKVDPRGVRGVPWLSIYDDEMCGEWWGVDC